MARIPPVASRGAVWIASILISTVIVSAILAAGYLAEVAARRFPLLP